MFGVYIFVCDGQVCVCVCVCHEINVLVLEYYLCLIACQMLALFIMQRWNAC